MSFTIILNETLRYDDELVGKMHSWHHVDHNFINISLICV